MEPGCHHLNEYPKKTINETELFRLLGCASYEAYIDEVQALMTANRICPVRSSGLNGRIPALYNRYRIIKPDLSDNDLIVAEIRSLHPLFAINRYLSEVLVYQKHKSVLVPLSRYFWEHQKELNQPLSINERSFAIFRDEKLLSEHKRFIAGIMSYSGLEFGTLNCYETPEPFFSWKMRGIEQEGGSVLVLENKDIWYTLVRISEELNALSLFPEKIVLLVYGEGNKVTRNHDGLAHFLDRYFNDKFGALYYAGDLDVAGISIYQRLRENYQTLAIRPFTRIYHEMYVWAYNNRVQGRFDLPGSRNGHKHGQKGDVDIMGFLMETGAHRLFQHEELYRLAEAIRCGGMIPQETVNRSVLLKLLQEDV